MTELPVDFVRDDRGRPTAVPAAGTADRAAARLLADFLTLEVGRTSDGVDHIVARLAATAAGAPPYGGVGNALEFEIAAHRVTLADAWREPPERATLSPQALGAALQAWRRFIAETGWRD